MNFPDELLARVRQVKTGAKVEKFLWNGRAGVVLWSSNPHPEWHPGVDRLYHSHRFYWDAAKEELYLESGMYNMKDWYAALDDFWDRVRIL